MSGKLLGMNPPDRLQDTLTPTALAARLSVADRTVRRMGTAYESVYGLLPRDSKGHRRYPAEAVKRLELAARDLRSAPGSSMRDILAAQRDGLPMPRHPTSPPPVDVLEPVLAELRALRGEVAELRELVLSLGRG